MKLELSTPSSRVINKTLSALLSDEDSPDLTGWIAGCTSCVVLVFVIATLQWYRRRKIIPAIKKKRKQRKERLAAVKLLRGIRAVSTTPIKRDDFVSVYKHKIKNGTLPYQLQAIEELSDYYGCTIAQQLYNTEKNFSPQHIPFDHSRVALPYVEKDVSSGYINASYIYSDQVGCMKATHIAAQGPLNTTVNDFWRMIWNEKIKCIVMLTDFLSYTKQECVKYWHETYTLCADIHVMMERCHKTLHYTVRDFLISKVGHREGREVKHFQFHGWGTESLPVAGGLLDFRRRVNMYTSTLSVPTVVHCSTGSGRTGAYITLDRAMEKLDTHGVVDVLNTILSLRRYRPHLVTDTVFLEAIYEAFNLYIHCGQTVTPVSLLHQATTPTSSSYMKKEGIELEYKLLSELIAKLHVWECAAGHRLENRYKSRDIMVQPPERARPHLLTFDMTEHSDFINAVLVDGYSNENEYVVGEWPVQDSINDFWRLVLDKQIALTVVLHSFDRNPKKYPVFWPTTLFHRKRFGPVAVTLMDSADSPTYSVRTFTVGKYLLNSTEASNLYKHVTSSKMVFINQWPQANDSVDCWIRLISLMNDMKRWNELQHLNDHSTFVMSKQGVERAGLYCSLSICLEQIRNDSEVDVFSAVHRVKYNRPGLVSKEEYITLNNIVDVLRKKKLRSTAQAFAHIFTDEPARVKMF